MIAKINENLILNTSNLTKNFGNTLAISEVDFTLSKGEIRAIVGANGAGKSTFVKILSGEIKQDKGNIYFNNKEVKFDSPLDAKKKGIAIVQQDFGLISSLSILENFAIYSNLNKRILYNPKVNFDDILNSVMYYLPNIDINTSVYNLSVFEKQLVTIAKALYLNSQIIILDEPTSVLSFEEFIKIKKVLNDLKAKGKSIIFITHKLEEIVGFVDSISVFKDGKLILSKAINKTTIKEVENILGIDDKNPTEIFNEPSLSECISIRNLSIGNVVNFSIKIKNGESIGILARNPSEGSGLLSAIYGAVPKLSGEVIKEKKNINCISDSLKNKICYIPEDRRTEAVFNNLSVLENLLIPSYKPNSLLGSLNISLGQYQFSAMQRLLSIKFNNQKQKINELSGGNQQKIIIGRWLNFDFDLLLMVEPTAGIDMKTRNDIYKIINELKSKNKSFIISSGNIKELKAICDRIIVINEGVIVQSNFKSEFNKL